MTHGDQVGLFDLRFELPSVCAQSVRTGTAAIGLVPVIEVFRQNLEVVADVGIASDGAVRSIFLVHKKPMREIRSVALDSSSRTSVALVRILLAEEYGVVADEHEVSPRLTRMLEGADAAVLIGDPALQLDIESCPYGILDLGEAWKHWSGLPMVYAVWAGQAPEISSKAGDILHQSYEFGKANIEGIIQQEGRARSVPDELARRYLTNHIRYELDATMFAGMREFKRLARKHGLV